jgi:predicted  nucleic acid-binding Zn-ribbon protein
METLSAGTFVGAGSFRCQQCGYALTLEGSEPLSDCPSCGGSEFVRASLFSTERISQETTESEGAPGAMLAEPPSEDLATRVQQVREQLDQPGEYLVYEEGSEIRTVALTREWTRIGRSLAADVRFDDPTVSRRHALVVRHPDGVRLLDDRSLNGVFVNGARVDGRALQDGDEIIVGRYRLTFARIGAEAPLPQDSGSGPVSSVG